MKIFFFLILFFFFLMGKSVFDLYNVKINNFLYFVFILAVKKNQIIRSPLSQAWKRFYFFFMILVNSPNLLRPCDQGQRHQRHDILKLWSNIGCVAFFFKITTPCCTGYLAPGWFEEKMNWRMNTLRNGCFGKMNDHTVHTKPPPS